MKSFASAPKTVGESLRKTFRGSPASKAVEQGTPIILGHRAKGDWVTSECDVVSVKLWNGEMAVSFQHMKHAVHRPRFR